MGEESTLFFSDDSEKQISVKVDASASATLSPVINLFL